MITLPYHDELYITMNIVLVISVVSIVVSISLIIAGSVLIKQNPHCTIDTPECSDIESRRRAGIGMLVVGIVLFLGGAFVGGYMMYRSLNTQRVTFCDTFEGNIDEIEQEILSLELQQNYGNFSEADALRLVGLIKQRQEARLCSQRSSLVVGSSGGIATSDSSTLAPSMELEPPASSNKQQLPQECSVIRPRMANLLTRANQLHSTELSRRNLPEILNESVKVREELNAIVKQCRNVVDEQLQMELLQNQDNIERQMVNISERIGRGDYDRSTGSRQQVPDVVVQPGATEPCQPGSNNPFCGESQSQGAPYCNELDHELTVLSEEVSSHPIESLGTLKNRIDTLDTTIKGVCNDRAVLSKEQVSSYLARLQSMRGILESRLQEHTLKNLGLVKVAHDPMISSTGIERPGYASYHAPCDKEHHPCGDDMPVCCPEGTKASTHCRRTLTDCNKTGIVEGLNRKRNLLEDERNQYREKYLPVQQDCRQNGCTNPNQVCCGEEAGPLVAGRCRDTMNSCREAGMSISDAVASKNKRDWYTYQGFA